MHETPRKVEVLVTWQGKDTRQDDACIVIFSEWTPTPGIVILDDRSNGFLVYSKIGIMRKCRSRELQLSTQNFVRAPTALLYREYVQEN